MMPKPPRSKFSKLMRVPERDEEDMTLCIAARASKFEGDNVKTSIYFCADFRIETFAASSETEYKFHKVADSWAGMLAGNVARASELLDLYSSHLAGKAPTGEQALNELRIPV